MAAAPKDQDLAGAPLNDNAPVTAVAVGLNVLALAATARAQRLDKRNAAAEAARQHDELQRYHQDIAPIRAEALWLPADFNCGGGRGARCQELLQARRVHVTTSRSDRSMASSRGSSSVIYGQNLTFLLPF